MSADIFDTSKFALFIFDEVKHFLDSEFYKNWRQDELNHIKSVYERRDVVPMTFPDITACEFSESLPKPTFAEIQPSPSTRKYVQNEDDLHIQDLSNSNRLITTTQSVPIRHCSSQHIGNTGSTVEDVIEVADGMELQKILDRDSWLFTLICTMENAPCCFSITTVNLQSLKFPIIYVNKHFETFTGYDRSEILGDDINLLQYHPQQSQINYTKLDQMLKALKRGHEYSSMMTSYMKSGVLFDNYLHIKPVFDVLGEYVYVLNVQFVVQDNEDEIIADRLASSLMKSVLHWIGQRRKRA